MIESELALQFENETGRWLKLGAADDFRRSQERNAVIRALVDAGKPMTPSDLADVTGKKLGAMKMMVSRMTKDGEITALGDGTYAAAEL